MKKYLSIALALILVLMLAACGGGGSNAPDGGQAPDQPDGGDVKTTDTNTVAVGAVIIVRDDVPEDVVYNFVSTIYENIDTITQQHAKGGELDLAFASSVTDVPYHPGAARYFEEKGITVSAVKEGAGTGSGNAVTFTTGGETGTYFAFGGVLGQFISGNTDVSVTVVSSNGSQSNIEDIAAGNAQFGFTQSDVLSYAYNGQRLFEQPVTNISVVCALYLEQVQIVTTDPSIKTVADLAGKKVSIGASGSGTYFNAIDCLGAYGLSEADIDPVFQNFADSAESLKDGKIAAAFIVAGAPTTAITDLAAAKQVYLVSFDEEHVNALVASSPYYTPYTIPAGTY